MSQNVSVEHSPIFQNVQQFSYIFAPPKSLFRASQKISPLHVFLYWTVSQFPFSQIAVSEGENQDTFSLLQEGVGLKSSLTSFCVLRETGPHKNTLRARLPDFKETLFLHNTYFADSLKDFVQESEHADLLIFDLEKDNSFQAYLSTLEENQHSFPTQPLIALFNIGSLTPPEKEALLAFAEKNHFLIFPFDSKSSLWLPAHSKLTPLRDIFASANQEKLAVKQFFSFVAQNWQKDILAVQTLESHKQKKLLPERSASEKMEVIQKLQINLHKSEKNTALFAERQKETADKLAASQAHIETLQHHISLLQQNLKALSHSNQKLHQRLAEERKENAQTSWALTLKTLPEESQPLIAHHATLSNTSASGEKSQPPKEKNRPMESVSSLEGSAQAEEVKPEDDHKNTEKSKSKPSPFLRIPSWTKVFQQAFSPSSHQKDRMKDRAQENIQDTLQKEPHQLNPQIDLPGGPESENGTLVAVENPTSSEPPSQKEQQSKETSAPESSSHSLSGDSLSEENENISSSEDSTALLTLEREIGRDDTPSNLEEDLLLEVIDPEVLLPPTLREHEKGKIQNVLFVAGEPHTPGVLYRCYRNAEACRLAGLDAQVANLADINPDHITWADCLIVWRAEFSGHVDIMIHLAHEKGIPVIFDADDIVFKPELARIDIIDGIRTIGSTEYHTEQFFTNVRRTLVRSDYGIASTPELAQQMSEAIPPVQVMRNIYDRTMLTFARRCVRQRQLLASDGLIRIGYTSGTRTHQKDFLVALPALIKVLRQRPEVRLVLFRESGNKRPILIMEEFPELLELSSQVEWRDTVPLEELSYEFSRFDISIAPLEVDNIFCNAKSEIKFTEAALANVCSVVSPTGPFKRLVIHGKTGFLATTPEEWEHYLLELIDNPDLRQKMAQAAYHSVLWNFGPERQGKQFKVFLDSISKTSTATESMELLIKRGPYSQGIVPVVPESTILYARDMLESAEVSVVITSYNYAHCIKEALDSVYQQDLSVIDLIVVDDGSSDSSQELLVNWAQDHANRFNRLYILQSQKNSGLGGARNIGIAATETPYIMQLDADNRLLPAACSTLLKTLKDNPLAAFAYPLIQPFGEKSNLMGERPQGEPPYYPLSLVRGNYIDAMAMITRWGWAAAGGYYVNREAMGWEDFDLWCTFAEMGLYGVQAKTILAEYRVHHTSMTNTLTEQNTHKPKVVEFVENRHPWVKILAREGLHRH
ncbi:glycosyltransferase [Entomobacter blattae]|uniref:Glycosyl transferase family 2 n=1 Tax=Entomobacter blattae TaxID=2762277 RepID=A0A7H1NQ79_9PROT|nr:glycosyltransferase [Entomobacter blattae]QNT77939.1 Glycosyl transferase family 2 [Entomobacter blattae]